MAKDLWLPKGYTFPDGLKSDSIIYAGDSWQIIKSHTGGKILVVRSELAGKWTDAHLLDGQLFGEIQFGSLKYFFLSCEKHHLLAPVEECPSPDSKVDALAFSISLKESRKISKDDSFHDAIYVEQYSRLLPTWTLTPHVDDEIVLGTWITGGVVISTNSFRRLSNLASWMHPTDLLEIIEAGGLQIPENAGVIARQNTKTRKLSNEKNPITEIKDQKNEVTRSKNQSEFKHFELPGRPKLKDFFNEHVVDIIFYPEKYQAMGIEFPSAIVLHGPPGCGKTFAAERLVEFIDWPSFSIDSNSVGSPFIHETSKKISEMFDKAIDAAPSVLLIDEMESFLSDRRSGGTSSLHHVEEVAEFLRRIPEAINNKVLIIAMTNLIELIDPAILRRGRFDHIIEVGMPSRVEVESLLTSLLNKLPKSDDLNLKPLLDSLTGKPLSDAAFVIREAARIAAKAGKTNLDNDCISSSLSNLPGKNEEKGRRIGF